MILWWYHESPCKIHIFEEVTIISRYTRGNEKKVSLYQVFQITIWWLTSSSSWNPLRRYHIKEQDHQVKELIIQIPGCSRSKTSSHAWPNAIMPDYYIYITLGLTFVNNVFFIYVHPTLIIHIFHLWNDHLFFCPIHMISSILISAIWLGALCILGKCSSAPRCPRAWSFSGQHSGSKALAGMFWENRVCPFCLKTKRTHLKFLIDYDVLWNQLLLCCLTEK